MATEGKNRRRQFEARDTAHGQTLLVDSQEEVFFLEWLCEAKALGAISDFQYQPDSFRLFETVRYLDVDGKERTMFRDHVYSCDFAVTFDANAQRDLARELKIRYEDAQKGPVTAYIDTKGLFNRNARSFSTDRKWVWDKFGVYVAEVVPPKFFGKFGVPAASRVSKKTGRPRKAFAGMRPIAEKMRAQLAS